jgi:hypothetical protein
MTNSPIRLRGPLLKLQRARAKCYALLQQHFEGNLLISETWSVMARDLEAQAESLKKLPVSFWVALKKQEKELTRATELSLEVEPNGFAGSLRECLTQTLDLEEPIILRIYAPLIRTLRSVWSDRSVDFYVMVKAHIARIERLVMSYSGDPALGQRCAVLFQTFEKEVQEPAAIEAAPRKPVHRKAVSSKKSGRPAAVRRAVVATTAKPSRVLAKRAKPLVNKIEIPRRRARR